jgi:hypothetical protein
MLVILRISIIGLIGAGDVLRRRLGMIRKEELELYGALVGIIANLPRAETLIHVKAGHDFLTHRNFALALQSQFPAVDYEHGFPQ